MDYPPSEHFLRDLQITSWREAADVARAEIAIVDALRDATGAVSLGALVTLADLACARVALPAAAPDWTATVDLTVTSSMRPIEGVVTAEARLARVGSNIVVVDVELGPAGVAIASFARIPRTASVVTTPLLPDVGVRSRMDREGPPLRTAVTERMGLRVVGDAVVLENSDYVQNSFGTINGGVLGFLVTAAAEFVTSRTAGDVTLRYLGQTKMGPAHATAAVVRECRDHTVVDVTVRDAGADGLLLARASVTLV